MIYLKYTALATLGIVMTLFCVIFSPIIALFIKNNGYLPNWLNFYQTSDNPAIGDTSFQINEMSWTKSKYLYGVFWLIRNPAYGYDNYFGVKIDNTETYTTNNPDGLDYIYPVLHEGTRLQTIFSGGKKYFKWELVKAWSTTHYGRFQFGWQLNQPLQVGEIRSLVFTISPWMKIK